MALAQITGEDSFLYTMLLSIGIFGFVASFNGLLLAAGRTTYEFGKAKQFPELLGRIHPRFKTPHIALIFNMVIGIIALFSGKANEIITISVFGALTMYIFACFVLFKLRNTEPNLERPFRVPFYPIFPIIALVIAVIAILAMAYYNQLLAVIFISIIAVSYGLYHVFVKQAVPEH
jgi:ethanolamine permease